MAGSANGLVFVACGLEAGPPTRAGGRRREVVINGKRVKTVDIHAHCAVPEALALMGQELAGPGLRTDLDMATEVDLRIKVMDEQGLEAVWLFPTLGVLYEEQLKQDPWAVGTTFRAFNRWVAEDWGLDYARLSATNPGLIMLRISGYGQTGPRRLEPAMDLIIQSASGLMSITGTAAGETVKTGHSIADITAGLFSLIGAMMALEARHRTGRGQFVDVSMMDTVMSTMLPSFARYLASGVVPKPMGTLFEGIVPYRNFVCEDREITLAVASDKLWKSFCEAIGRTDLANHPDYNTNPLRVKNRRVLEPLLEAMFRSRPAAHWVQLLAQHGVPATVVRNLKEVIEDEQTTARNMTPTVQHPVAGPIRVIGVPVQLSETPGRIGCASPLLGADTAAILKAVNRD